MFVSLFYSAEDTADALVFTFQLIRVLVQFGTLKADKLDVDYLCGKGKEKNSFYQLCFAKLKFIQHLAKCVAQAKDDDEGAELIETLRISVLPKFRNPFAFCLEFASEAKPVQLSDEPELFSGETNLPGLVGIVSASFEKYRNTTSDAVGTFADLLYGTYTNQFDASFYAMGREMAADRWKFCIQSFLNRTILKGVEKELLQGAFQKHTRAFGTWLKSTVKTGTGSASGDDSGGPATSAPANPLQILSDVEELEKNSAWAKLLQKRKEFVRVWFWGEDNKFKWDQMRTYELQALLELYQKTPFSKLNLTQKKGAKKDLVRRCWILSAELFIPNMGRDVSQEEANKEFKLGLKVAPKYKKVVTFINNQRHKKDFVVFFDARNREFKNFHEKWMESQCVTEEEYDTKVAELILSYKLPKLNSDPRFPKRRLALSAKNLEVAHVLCGESKSRMKALERDSNAYKDRDGQTTHEREYREIVVRPLHENHLLAPGDRKRILNHTFLPSYSENLKRALGRDSDANVPFSFHDWKPLNILSAILRDLDVTHVMDLSPGSSWLATACAWNRLQYDCLCNSAEHAAWLEKLLNNAVLTQCVEAVPEEGEKAFHVSLSKYFSNMLSKDKDMAEDDEEEEQSGADSDDF